MSAPRAGARASGGWLARGGAALALVLACASPASAQGPAPDPEPPPEAGDGDYTWELPDSLAADELEWTVGATGRAGKAPRRSQRVTFRGGGASGTLRHGDAELGSGRVEAPFAGGSLAAGTLAPRWGRGLVLGGAAEPWSPAPEDRGREARFRGRSGSGLAFEGAHVSALAGRFARRELAGVGLAAGPMATGLLASRRDARLSAALTSGPHAAELAFDAAGRWRAEGVLAASTAGTRLVLRARGGHDAFRSLAEPARSGPARAIAASASRGSGRLRASAFGSWWAWRAGRAGTRGALEVDAGLGQHASMACGVLQQQGPRRDPPPRARPTGPRQGWWCEWRGGPPGARLALRHELWGARAFAHDAVRRAVVARGDWALPFGARVALTHAVWRARSGESLMLPEARTDRLVLRALGGAGTRTLGELHLPFASGTVRVSVGRTVGGTRVAPPTWSVEWSRRSRLAPGAASPH